MRQNKIKHLVLGVIAAAILLPGVLTSTAVAQTRQIRRPRPLIVYRHHNPFWYRRYDPFWNPYWGPTAYSVVDPIAYQKEQGYSEGRSEGKDDAKKGNAPNPTGHKDYLKSSSLAFREAFVQGYNERYREEVAKIQKKARDKDAD